MKRIITLVAVLAVGIWLGCDKSSQGPTQPEQNNPAHVSAEAIVVGAAAAQTIFSVDFGSPPCNTPLMAPEWFGKNEAPTPFSGTVVTDPQNPNNCVLTFNLLTEAGDTFSKLVTATPGLTYLLEFDYLGTPGQGGWRTTWVGQSGSRTGSRPGIAGWRARDRTAVAVSSRTFSWTMASGGTTASRSIHFRRPAVVDTAAQGVSTSCWKTSPGPAAFPTMPTSTIS